MLQNPSTYSIPQFATFAAAKAGPPSSPGVVMVKADETQNGLTTIHFYDGANFNLLSMSKVVTKLQMNDRIVFEGDSITAASANNIASWCLAFNGISRGSLYYPVGYLKAVGGKTLGLTTTNIPNVLAVNPKIVCLMIGTNDLPGGGSAQTLFNQISSIVNAYLAGGVSYVILGKILPRQIGGTSTYAVITPAQEVIRQQLNVLIGTLASGCIKVIDIEANFNASTDLLSDGLHPTWKGAIKYATAVNAAIQQITVANDPIAQYFPNATTNVLTAASQNSNMSGTAGTKTGANVTGTVADGWSVTDNGGMTVVCSSVANGDGTFGQRMQVSGTNSANGKTVTLSRTFSGMATYGAVGDFFEQLMRFNLQAGAAGLGDVQLYGTLCGTPLLSSYFPTADQAWSGVLRASPTGALASSSYTFNLGLVFAAGTVGADITVDLPVLQKLQFAS